MFLIVDVDVFFGKYLTFQATNKMFDREVIPRFIRNSSIASIFIGIRVETSNQNINVKHIKTTLTSIYFINII